MFGSRPKGVVGKEEQKLVTSMPHIKRSDTVAPIVSRQSLQNWQNYSQENVSVRASFEKKSKGLRGADNTKLENALVKVLQRCVDMLKGVLFLRKDASSQKAVKVVDSVE